MHNLLKIIELAIFLSMQNEGRVRSVMLERIPILLSKWLLKWKIIICGEISLSVRENSVSISNNFMLIAHCPQTWNNKTNDK